MHDELNPSTFDITNLGDDVLLSPSAAAAVLGQSTSTLAKQRLTGDGCPFTKVSRSVRYRIGDIRAFVASKRRLSTSDSGAEGAQYSEKIAPSIC